MSRSRTLQKTWNRCPTNSTPRSNQSLFSHYISRHDGRVSLSHVFARSFGLATGYITGNHEARLMRTKIFLVIIKK